MSVKILEADARGKQAESTDYSSTTSITSHPAWQDGDQRNWAAGICWLVAFAVAAAITLDTIAAQLEINQLMVATRELMIQQGTWKWD